MANCSIIHLFPSFIAYCLKLSVLFLSVYFPLTFLCVIDSDSYTKCLKVFDEYLVLRIMYMLFASNRLRHTKVQQIPQAP
jgi:hypothetical protein